MSDIKIGEKTYPELIELCELLDNQRLYELAFEYTIAERWELVLIVAAELKKRIMADKQKAKIVMDEMKQGGFD